MVKIMRLLAAVFLLALISYPSGVSSIALLESIPGKVFTPNGDGVNDRFILVIENASGSIFSQKSVYDLRGNEVADLQVLGDETAARAVFIWDGRNQSGDIVRSGVYIYQLQAESKIINGTIVVAR